MRSMIFQKKLHKSFQINKNLTAIEENGNAITYNELHQASNKVTRSLLNQNLNKETVVGISVETKLQLISSIIGGMNTRCVFVPLDFNLPLNRLEEMISDMKMNHIIISNNTKYPELTDKLTQFNIEDILLQKETVESIALPKCKDDDSIYIYFTSGSTGKAKGIIGKNSSLAQFIEWEIEKFNFVSGGRFSQFISPYFDAFLRDIFVPLLSGGTICVPPSSKDFFSEDRVNEWIDENKISVIHCVPSIFRIINNKTLTPTNFQTLTHILLSGEKIIPSELVSWYNVFDSKIQLVNLYGTTETTMVRAYYEIQPKDAKAAKIPIGFPIADTELLISNGGFKPCKPLVPGELYIISKYVTKGYLNNPDLTSKKFFKLNEKTQDEVIAFRTGDRARILADGKVELLGRNDRQIKLMGVRIELDEIEQVLLKSPVVDNAIVICDMDSKSLHQSIVAFIIRNDEILNTVPFIDSVKLYLKENLPVYMIPSNIIEVNEYPLMSNGKTDFKRLLNTLKTLPTASPNNKVESDLLTIWKEIFGDKTISTEVGFERIGGNSLSILSLVSKIEKSFGIRFSLSEIVSHNSIQKQAAFISEIQAE